MHSAQDEESDVDPMIHSVDARQVPVIRLHGDLALPGAARLRADMLEVTDGAGATGAVESQDGDARHVVVDLTAVTSVDSTGLGVLVGARTRLRQRGGTLHLVVDSDRVLRTFRISSLIRVFPIHATVDDALAATRRPAPSDGEAGDGSLEAVPG